MYKLLAPCLLLALSPPCWAQAKQPEPDSATAQLAGKKAIDLYHRALGNQAHIFNGSEYVDYEQKKEGHQYFLTNQWTYGTITYGGLEYTNIPMLYNLETDDVIIGQFSEAGRFNQIKLNRQQVSGFTLSGNRFVHLRKHSAPEHGFYQELYAGHVQVLARRRKEYKKDVVTLSFPEKDSYYLMVGGKYHEVKSKSSVMKVLKGHKKELSAFLRANNIVFSQNREQALSQLAAQYDVLTQASR